MKHGVLLENLTTGVNIHTFKDWGLIFAPKEISPPTPKTSYLEIEGRDGSLDLTEALGGIKYNDREFTLDFTLNTSYKKFDETISEILNFIHGARMKITIYSDPDYYYIGRCQIDKISSKSGQKTISIKCKTEPYKYRKYITKKAFDITVTNKPKKIALYNEKRPIVPTIYVDSDTDIKFNGSVYNLKTGKNIVLNILLQEGENIFEVLSTTNIVFEYQEASL